MNFVQVLFQQDNGYASSKLYTYRNRCDLYVGDYAMVDVRGIKKVVKVAKVCKDLPAGAPSIGQLKWIEGAVYLDETVEKLKAARATLEALHKKSRERARETAETMFLNKQEKVEYDKLKKFVEEQA